MDHSQKISLTTGQELATRANRWYVKMHGHAMMMMAVGTPFQMHTHHTFRTRLYTRT
jgi:hypothetical protein